jgi:hypothetical protein
MALSASDDVVLAGVVVALLVGLIPPIENYVRRRRTRAVAAAALSGELQQVFVNAESARRLVTDFPIATGQCYRAIEHVRAIDLKLTEKMFEIVGNLNVAAAFALSLVVVNKDAIQRELKRVDAPERPLERSSLFAWADLKEQIEKFATYAANAYKLVVEMAGTGQSPAVEAEIQENVRMGMIDRSAILEPTL